jgi:hypothetical protein
MLIHSGLMFRVYLEKWSKDEKKNDTKKERMKAYLRFEPWSFNFWPFYGFTHELIDPKQTTFG